VLQQLLVRRVELHAGRQPRQVLDRRRRLQLTDPSNNQLHLTASAIDGCHMHDQIAS
jgi:hypothetical protein